MLKERFREDHEKENTSQSRTTLLRKQRKSSKDIEDASVGGKGFRLLYP